MSKAIQIPDSGSTRALMDAAYADEVQLPQDTKFEGSLPVVEDWEDESDE